MKRFFLILSLGILIVACKQNKPETNTNAIEKPIEKVRVEVDNSSTEASDDVATEDFREFKVLDSE
ncbi:MAG: hypothetical protein AAGH46_10810, partial [Bacteroidota bacterium]